MRQRRRDSIFGAPTSIHRRERTRDASNSVSLRTNRNIRGNLANFRTASLSSNFANRRALRDTRDITLAQPRAIKALPNDNLISSEILIALLISRERPSCSYFYLRLIQSWRTTIRNYILRASFASRDTFVFSHIVILRKKIPALSHFWILRKT